MYTFHTVCEWFDVNEHYPTLSQNNHQKIQMHDDVIKWKHFPRYWPFVRGIHRSPVNSPYKGQWRGALMFSLICTWINRWVNNGEAGDLRRYRAHYDVIEMNHLFILMNILTVHWTIKSLFISIVFGNICICKCICVYICICVMLGIQTFIWKLLHIYTIISIDILKYFSGL